jgi:hypothetical protein
MVLNLYCLLVELPRLSANMPPIEDWVVSGNFQREDRVLLVTGNPKTVNARKILCDEEISSFIDKIPVIRLSVTCRPGDCFAENTSSDTSHKKRVWIVRNIPA